MERLVLKYLNTNFMFTLSTLSSYHVKSRHTNEILRISDLVTETKTSLNISEEELFPILDKWVESEFTKINNILVDAKYLMYGENGKVTDLDSYKEYLAAVTKIVEKG